MPFLTNERLLDALADLLREAGGGSSLPAAFASIIGQANDYSRNAITSALGALGYTPAQVARWDQLEAYHQDLALWRALTKGAMLIDFDKDRIDMLDMRKDLSREADPPFQFTAGGVIESPGSVLTGDPVGGRGIASGTITSTGSRILDDTTF
jgi:hypothetical protein